ncbi:hypothetical protein [Vibrio harveyi]|uniref:hypothetical protein n=1 Tax=Vibrio harveyi TaxID=669 RepID=UPI0023806394|nr:hypothetical protein [Vibrio harveyi]
MANFIKSFQQGMDVGNQFIDTLDRRERQKRADERNQVLQDRQDTLWQQGQEDRKQSLEDAKKARERDDIRFEREGKTYDLNTAATKQSMGIQKEEGKRAETKFNFDMKAANRKSDNDFTDQALKSVLVSGDFSAFTSPEMKEVLERNPQLSIPWITDNKTLLAANRLTHVINGLANGKMPDWNDPTVMGDLNQIFPEIGKSTDLPQFTSDGKRIVNREITGVIPMKGGQVAIQMSITDEDGNTYEAPMTQKRSTDPDDQVALVGFDYLTTRIKAVNEAQTNEAYKKVRDYLTLQSGKGSGSSSDSKAKKQELQYKAENDLNKKFFDEETAIRNDMSLDEEQRKVKLAELDQRRDREFAQLRLRTSNVFGKNRANLESEDREKDINSFMDTAKQAYPDVNFTPELQGNLRDAINRGADDDAISWIINQAAKKQEASTSDREADGSEQSRASKAFEKLLGTPSVTDTGAPTTTGGRFYHVGNDLLKPNVVNKEQAEMTPYQARQTGEVKTNYNPYGS